MMLSGDDPINHLLIQGLCKAINAFFVEKSKFLCNFFENPIFGPVSAKDKIYSNH